MIVGDLETGSVYVCITVCTHVYKSIQSTNDYTCMCTSVCVSINNILLTFGLVNTDILVFSLENQTDEQTYFRGISTPYCLSSEIFIVLFTCPIKKVS